MSRRSERLGRVLQWDSGGIRLAGTPLWIDSRHPMELCLISHAHGDHVGDHVRSIATATTLNLLGIAGKTGVMPCQYQHPFELGKLRLELYPSGHLPGSAQLLVEHKGDRILYTGDIYDGRQHFARPMILTTCDLLLIEATYGTIRHRFPPREVAARMLRDEVNEALDSDATPLILVEGSLGRAQEIIYELSKDGHKLVASKSIAKWNRRYRDHGLDVPPCGLYGGRPVKGSVLLYPMRSRGLKGLRAIKNLVKIACTGQVGEESVAKRLGVDRVVPFVDHADFDGLVRIAEVCRPAKVLTVFGHAETLARKLCERGLDAEPLREADQLSLNI